MRRIILITSLVALFATGVLAQTKGADYSGTWELDKSKSTLPEMMQAIEGLTWVVTQDDETLKREQQLAGAMAGPGGGGGRGRGMGMNQPLTVKLDGSETNVETRRGTSTITAKWMDEGKMLEISTISTFNIQGEEMKLTSTEHWELAEGGKVLKVHQARQTPRGSMEATFVFNKK